MICILDTDLVNEFPPELGAWWPESMRSYFDEKFETPREVQLEIIHGFLAVMMAAEILVHVRFSGPVDAECIGCFSGPDCITLTKIHGGTSEQHREICGHVVGQTMRGSDFPVNCSQVIHDQGFVRATAVVRPAHVESSGKSCDSGSAWHYLPIQVQGDASEVRAALASSLHAQLLNVAMFVSHS